MTYTAQEADALFRQVSNISRTVVMYLRENGGATMSLYGFIPADGYMVGGLVTESVWPMGESDDRRVSEFVTRHAKLLNENHDLFIGAWYDEETGNAHLDVSERFDTEGAAMLFAREREQIAIFDLAGKREIRV